MQQSTYVKRLEEKLKDTEQVLTYHIQHQQQQQHLIENGSNQPFEHLSRSPPSSPKYKEDIVSKQSSRPQKESRERRPYEEYLSSLRGFNDHINQMNSIPFKHPGVSAANDDRHQHDYGAEIDTRLQDLTFQEEELSDEEDNLRTYSSRGKEPNFESCTDNNHRGSPSAISVLKEVLMDLILKETRRGGHQEQAVIRNGRSDWKQKIRKEKTLIFNVKKALKLENVYVKQACAIVMLSQNRGMC